MLNRLVYERFGSRNGLLRYLCHSFLAKMGVYRGFSSGKPVEFQRLVFVCSGNICRSPLAEVYARSLGKSSASCGLNCGDGYPADPRARKFAESQGLNLESHKTVNVRDFEFRDTDLIVVMEPSHIRSFQEKIGTPYRMILAGTFCSNPNPYIHDPFNCNPQFFDHCELKVMEAVRRICE